MILPIKNITYRTALTEEVVIQKLSENVEPTDSPFMSRLGATKLYKGKIIGNTFKIRRKLYRRSLVPTIKGVIEDHHSGTIIKVTLGMPMYSALFFILFVLFFLFVLSAASESSRITGDSSLLGSGIIHVLGLIVVTILMIGSFAFESNKTREELQNIFEADIIGG